MTIKTRTYGGNASVSVMNRSRRNGKIVPPAAGFVLKLTRQLVEEKISYERIKDGKCTRVVMFKSKFIQEDGRILIEDFSARQQTLLVAWKAGYKASAGELSALKISTGPSKRKGYINLEYQHFIFARERFIAQILTQRQIARYRKYIELLFKD